MTNFFDPNQCPPFPLGFKSPGWLKGKLMIFLLLRYLGCSPTFLVFKWAHLSLNSKPVPRYSRWDEGWFDPFWHVFIGNRARKIPKFQINGRKSGNLPAICHETWQFGSSDGPTKMLCGNFENFDFLAGCAARKVQKWGKPYTLNTSIF